MASFDHPLIEKYAFEDIPLDRDLFLIDEKWVDEHENVLLEMFSGGPYPVVGYISYAAVRSIGESVIELSWYPNNRDRFHEVKVSLPRDQFVICVESRRYDVRPHIFVKGEWLRNLYLKPYAVFAMVDAIGVKQALKTSTLTGEKLIAVRSQIDEIARNNPDIAFISFADIC